MIPLSLRLVLRSIRKSPVFNLLSILCLTTGMVTVILVYLWIRDEMSYDSFHPKSASLYRFTIKVEDKERGYYSHFARSYFPWVFEMKEKVPGIQEMARLAIRKNYVVKTSEDEVFNADLIQSDPQVFSVFHFSFLRGDPSTAFEKPYSVILTKPVAEKYFGKKDPLGQTLELYCDRCTERVKYTVTAVVEEYPVNSHFHFDLLATIDDPASFSDWAYYYVLLEVGTEPESIIQQFKGFAADYIPDDYAANLTPFLQKITDIHLHSAKDREIEENGNYRDIARFAWLSFFVMFIALFNYSNVRQVNLIRNNRTFSVLRIHGAEWKNIFHIQLLESIFISVLAMVVALFLVLVFLPGFNQLSLKNVTPATLISDPYLGYLVAGLIMISGISGIVPFLFYALNRNLFSRKSREYYSLAGISHNKYRLTRITMAMQFAVSLILIVTVLVVNRQLNFFMSNRLGSKQPEILCLKNIPVQVLNHYGVFRSALLSNPLITEVTSSFENPADENMDMMPFKTDQVADDLKDKLIFVYPAADNFFRFYQVPVVAGRDFPDWGGNDSLPETYILNRRACEYLGWQPEDAVGKPFELVFELNGKNLFIGGRIIGVVEDFQMSSMKNEIKPYVFFQKSFWLGSIQIKYDIQRRQEALEFIMMEYSKTFPGFPPQYEYVEDLYLKIYRNEFRLQNLSLLLGLLAVILSSLGLWGITGVLYRTKYREIAIRKVTGAHRTTLVLWLLKDINLIWLLSVIAGLPASFILVNRYLENYPLRISPEWWMFAVPAGITWLITLTTVLWQAILSSGINPAVVLKSE